MYVTITTIHHSFFVLILAAGTSTRMGQKNKLLLQFKGRPLIQCAVDCYKHISSNISVVIGFEGDKIKDALSNSAVEYIYNPDYEMGLQTSFQAGLRALSGEEGALLVALGDQIFITPNDIEYLLSVYEKTKGKKIIIPQYDDQRGHPIIFPPHVIRFMKNTQPISSGREYIEKYPECCQYVKMATNHCIIDIDTPQDAAEHLAAYDHDD